MFAPKKSNRAHPICAPMKDSSIQLDVLRILICEDVGTKHQGYYTLFCAKMQQFLANLADKVSFASLLLSFILI